MKLEQCKHTVKSGYLKDIQIFVKIQTIEMKNIPTLS